MTADARILRVIDYETTGTPDDTGAEVIEMANVEVDPVARAVMKIWCRR